MAMPPSARRRGLLAGVSCAALVMTAPALSETRPSLNLYGATGLIDMPSGEAQPDGIFNTSITSFAGITRTTLTFQITPRLSASFRYQGIGDWNKAIPEADRVGVNKFDTYYDRSFDLRFRAFDEGRYMPAVTIGLQDFVGTGIQSAEYVAATKHLTPRLKVTAGVGWGRLGSYGSFGGVGTRPEFVPQESEGGEVNADQWFRGDMAGFAGIEWQPTDRLTLKAEYSSDDYEEEAEDRQIFDRKSPFNFGAEYEVSRGVQLGAYYMYGSEIGLGLHFVLNPRDRATTGLVDRAPTPIRPRPARAADPEAWSSEWVTQADAPALLRNNMQKQLDKDGVLIEAFGTDGRTAQIRIRNIRYDAEAQAIGRTARAMAYSLPASVETFEIVPVVNGMPLSKVTVARSDLERFEFAPDAATRFRPHVSVGEAGTPIDGLEFNPQGYGRLNWSLAPYLRTSLFDPKEPIRGDVGLRLRGEYEVMPGVLVSGVLSHRFAGNLDGQNRSESGLPRVRTDNYLYSREGETTLDSLTAALYARPARDVYSRVTVGYLERMYGGASAELMWKPVDSPLALGVEINYAKKRDFDQGLGFLSGAEAYDVVSGHASAYYDFGNQFIGQLDVGRYLAGDVGATLSIDREFENGWKVGAFATLTDASAEEFGEGSFDKGIRISIPLASLLGRPTRENPVTTIRALSRDGGARLNIDGRLYEAVRHYHSQEISDQWGRFWK
ncbi:YjbH domain-containing protein [Cereibacter sphaeroides]|uniref:YjbH domain-containing protein n=1 Tax=Cereibacter sphaeroides TaxID=1063 RepID=UPI000F5297A8|nr:YjbH domain-containing protein [Cereibacter sphaeroides]AZB62395.1 YjbH domain-containing protein [Cereibacter sphaeroides]AZB69655.1 YjbH domain-containing protein [Cereibacter sphaeroides]